MIKKIICPTDFSKAADNAVAYAAKLCQLANAELEVIHLQTQSVLESVFAGKKAIKKTRYASQALDDVCREVNKTFHISCSGLLETPAEFFEKSISPEDGESRLLVMGTNGADDLYQRIFGTNTFRTLKKAECPVLVIPENVSYATISKIIFAWDYSIASKKFYPQLRDFLEIFNPEIDFLHVSRHDTKISQDVFSAVKENMEELLEGTKIKTGFSRIHTDNVIESIDKYMLASEANLLTLVFHDELFDTLISVNGLIKRITQTANYPVLVMHEMG
ncbi:MAG TPA: universal stress protein [Bacteroidia bacterium]|nr:universal stress protein [Bacteroidia bacterium]